MMMEAGVVLGLNGQPIYWHLPADRTGGSLPDSRPLWDVLWENRGNLLGFAHSHPGSGVPGPSYTDVTTFSAIELGLGKRLLWYITSSDHVAVFQWVGPHPYHYEAVKTASAADPEWVRQLRDHSRVIRATTDHKEITS